MNVPCRRSSTRALPGVVAGTRRRLYRQIRGGFAEKSTRPAGSSGRIRLRPMIVLKKRLLRGGSAAGAWLSRESGCERTSTMKIAVIGTGYVGLVTGTCFAESGNDVTCIDIDQDKIARLKAGEIPIYEPGLAELVEANTAAGGCTSPPIWPTACAPARLVFLAVGTPQLARRLGRSVEPLGRGRSHRRRIWPPARSWSSRAPCRSAPTAESPNGWRSSPAASATWPAIPSSSRKGPRSTTS